MRWALRRILWIVPTLALISVAAFGALSFAGANPPGAAGLPRFFNSDPRGVRELAQAAAASIARDDDHSAEARRQLVRLGGAALPHILPELDRLSPSARARVALALSPVAERMGVGSAEELSDPQAAVVFWTRFWQDRAIDFRPALVKRAVRRLANRSTPGRLDDIRQLDTFALSELIEEMNALERPIDVERARRLAAAAAHVTGEPWTIAGDAGPAEAERVIADWQRWWNRFGSDYRTLDGVRRLLAMVTDTQYGRWAADAVRTRMGTTQSGEPVLDVMRARAPITLWLLAAGVFGGFAAGIALGLAGGAWAGRRADLVSSAIAIGVAALPVASIGAWLSPGPSALAALVVALACAALVSRYQRSATRVALDQEYARTARGFGASRTRFAFRSFPSSSAAAISLLGVELPTLVTAVFVVEHAFDLPGLGPATLSALATRDVAWLMAIALVSAATVALMQIASDVLLALLDPRVRVSLADKYGGVP